MAGSKVHLDAASQDLNDAGFHREVGRFGKEAEKSFDRQLELGKASLGETADPKAKTESNPAVKKPATNPTAKTEANPVAKKPAAKPAAKADAKISAKPAAKKTDEAAVKETKKEIKIEKKSEAQMEKELKSMILLSKIWWGRKFLFMT